MTDFRGRLPWWAPQELDVLQRDVYDSIVSGRRTEGPHYFRLTDAKGRLEGPFNAMLAAPRLGMALQQLGSRIRFESAMPARVRETAILQVARHHRSGFEWYAHERIGLGSGLTETEIGNILDGRCPPTFTGTERVLFEVADSLLILRDVDDGLFATASTVVNESVLMELVTLVGYYELLALLLRVWRVPLPDGVPPVFDWNPPG